MDPRERAEFINAYTRALITAWSSEEYAAKLTSDARTALAEVGLEVPANAEIVVVRTVPGGHHEANLDVQVELWEAGLASNRFEFHIPDTPQVDMSELSEGDLADITAGLTINCCCCPCCCCT